METEAVGDARGKIVKTSESPPPNSSEFINGRSPQFMQNVQKVTQFEPDNKCPDCVFMRLEIKPVETKIGIPLMSKTEVKSLELFLTLNFNWQEEKIKGGTIRFGIKRGNLSLTLSNCISPYESRNFVKKLEQEILVETETKNSNNHKTSSSSSLSVKEIKAQIGSDSQHNREETHKFKTTVCQVSGKGSENNPGWDFDVKDGNSCLTGGIVKEILARLEINQTPCIIEATFITSIKNLEIEGVDGIWPEKISRNKTAGIEKFLVRRILESQIRDYLSKQELRHG